MNLKEFIKESLLAIDNAVNEVNNENNYKAYFPESEGIRTVEFDIAVTADKTDIKKGKAGIKVLQFAEASGGLNQENRNSTVSRISFGVNLSALSKKEEKNVKTNY